MEIFTKNSAKCTVFQSTICNKFSSLMYTAACLEEFMDDFAHNNTDMCCLVAFAHWQGEDHMPFFY
jgi:hypothetical protein